MKLNKQQKKSFKRIINFLSDEEENFLEYMSVDGWDDNRIEYFESLSDAEKIKFWKNTILQTTFIMIY